MRDQEKSDFLKAKILAEKGMTSETDNQSKKPMDAIEKAKTIDAMTSLFSFVLGIVASYFTQLALFTKFSTTVPFTFWEVSAIYLFCTTSINFLSKQIRSILIHRK
jgi:hypothetical protein